MECNCQTISSGSDIYIAVIDIDDTDIVIEKSSIFFS